jgi:hypothetical protein
MPTSTGEEVEAPSGAAMAATSSGAATRAGEDPELMSHRDVVEDPARRRSRGPDMVPIREVGVTKESRTRHGPGGKSPEKSRT